MGTICEMDGNDVWGEEMLGGGNVGGRIVRGGDCQGENVWGRWECPRGRKCWDTKCVDEYDTFKKS